MISVNLPLLLASLFLTVLHLAQCQADSSDIGVGGNEQDCGALAGSCNAQVCCCNNGGFITQVPTDEGTCKAKPSSGTGGTLFLAVAGLFPAFASFVLFRMTTPLRMRSTGDLLSHSPKHARQSIAV